MDLETLTDNELSEKEQSESSESEEKSVDLQKQETLETSDDNEQQDAVEIEQNGLCEEDDVDMEKENESPDKKKRYDCKYCEFTTQNLGTFKEHVDSDHPKVILNPVYLCVACHFKTKKYGSLMEHNEGEHPGENNFKFNRTTVDNQTVLEQTIEAKGDSEDGEVENGRDTSCLSTSVSSPDSLPNGNSPLDQITAVNINGTVIIPEPSMLQGNPHVSPMLQRPPNFSVVPKIAVPLNSTKYNPSLDDNMTLIASFNKFPYPTHAELSWLTAASKHPQDQIKIWFTTQRLKQGITWSPEEVEEARKKMFNGSIPPVHGPAFTVAPVSSRTVVHTTTVETPRSSANYLNGLKRTLTAATSFRPEPKRPVMAVAPNPGEKGLMAPPPPPPLMLQKQANDAKRANAELKRTPNAVPLLQPPITQPVPKNKPIPVIPNNNRLAVVSLPSMVFPESLTRPMIAPPPIFAPPFKNNLLVPFKGTDNATGSLPDGMIPNSAPLISPQVRRPAIIQTIRAQESPNLPGFTAMDGKQLKELQNGGGEINNKASYNRTEANGKWPHKSLQNNGHLDDPKSDYQQKVMTQFPLLERMKGKTAEQLKVLEENFLRNSFPTYNDVDGLAASTSLSHQEIESWFSERRALRDNLEQALLNSMGTKRTVPNLQNVTEKRLQNGFHKTDRLLNLPMANANANSVPEDFVPTRWPFGEWFGENGSEHNGINGAKRGCGLLQNSDLIGQRCQDSTNGSKALDLELSWFNKSLSGLQHNFSRYRQGSVLGWMDERRAENEDSNGRLSG